MSQSLSDCVASPALRKYLTDLLVEICAIDTTPRADLAQLGAAEENVFKVLERHLGALQWNGLKLQRQPIDPAIEYHPFYSKPYYTVTAEQPRGLPAKTTYARRHNLLALADGASCATRGLALNGHIDVVKPYIPPRVEGNTVFGRGSCDDKGPVVAIMGALKLVSEHLARTGQRLSKPLTAMFVIEEEMGGNGSLSLALDRSLRKRYDTLAVLECCSSNIYPGNRGAIWFKVEARMPQVNLFEAAAFIVEEMEREGRSIKAESRHPLFPHRPVQTCHGILDAFGEHPSRICGRIDFAIRAADRAADVTKAADLIRDLIEDGLAQYIGLYGDKSKSIDQATGKPRVDHHYDLEQSSHQVTVRVHGSTGHMGSILLNDGAITKMAAMMRSLIASRPAIENAAGGKVELLPVNWPDPSHLVMEGGQGFLPTHPMPEVMDRLRCAVQRGASRYLALSGQDACNVAETFVVTFDKLHNAAFAGDPGSPAMRDAIEAAKKTGIWKDGQEVRGWDVSCDSRIFACEYADLQVITTGPGHLIHAHADNEQIDIDELVRFTGFLAQFILNQTL